jgi:hypothetical protein
MEELMLIDFGTKLVRSEVKSRNIIIEFVNVQSLGKSELYLYISRFVPGLRALRLRARMKGIWLE